VRVELKPLRQQTSEALGLLQRAEIEKWLADYQSSQYHGRMTLEAHHETIRSQPNAPSSRTESR
jgi:hypothetical protein